jgi:hypothetical protein
MVGSGRIAFHCITKFSSMISQTFHPPTEATQEGPLIVPTMADDRLSPEIMPWQS